MIGALGELSPYELEFLILIFSANTHFQEIRPNGLQVRWSKS